jgi:hypothetical protein
MDWGGIPIYCSLSNNRAIWLLGWGAQSNALLGPVFVVTTRAAILLPIVTVPQVLLFGGLANVFR